MKKIFIIGIANLLFILHILLGVILLVGWLFPTLQYYHLALLVIWMCCWVFLGYCPPTKWEFSLRRKYNKSIKADDEFIQFYMYKFFRKKISKKSILIGGFIIFPILVLLSVLQ